MGNRTAAGLSAFSLNPAVGLTSPVRGLPRLSNLRAMIASNPLKLVWSSQTANKLSAAVGATTPLSWSPVVDVLSKNELRQKSGVVVIVLPSQNARHQICKLA